MSPLARWQLLRMRIKILVLSRVVYSTIITSLYQVCSIVVDIQLPGVVGRLLLGAGIQVAGRGIQHLGAGIQVAGRGSQHLGAGIQVAGRGMQLPVVGIRVAGRGSWVAGWGRWDTAA